MNTAPSALADAHAQLTADVAKLAPRARSFDGVRPPDSVVYRNATTTRPSPADRDVLGRIYRALGAQVKAEGYTLLSADAGGGILGSTNHITQEVRITPGMQEHRQVGTLIHELAHIRLRHFLRGCHDQITRTEAEVVAESVAYLVGRALGLSMTEFSAPYVANWSDGDMRLLDTTKPMVLRVARQILADL